jgi:autotransporter-associated beta strand protein
VQGDPLQVSGQRYFNVGRTTTVESGAVLELIDSNNNFTTLLPTSTITGAGTFRLSGNSTVNQELNGVSGTRLTFAMESGGLIDLLDNSRLTNGGWQELNWTNNLAGMHIASDATFDLWDGQAVFIDALDGSGTIDKAHPESTPTVLTVGVDNGSGTFSGTITNTGGPLALVKTGTGTQTLSGTHTYTGNTTVADGTLDMAPSGSLRFRPTNNGQTNSLSGTASATLSYLGTIDLDLSAADTSGGNFWNLVDLGSFSGPSPTLAPAAVTSTLGSFTEESPGIWELSVTGAKWTFTEGDGALTHEVTACQRMARSKVLFLGTCAQ